MFQDIISNTPFTTDIARTMFPKITAESYRGDETMGSTIMALLYEQQAQDADINVAFNSVMARRFLDRDEGEKLTYLVGNNPGDLQGGFVKIISLRGDKDVVREAMELARKKFIDIGLKEIPKINMFYKKSFGVTCFINEDSNLTLILVDNLSVQKLHYLQLSTPLFIPWLFSSFTFTELQMEILESLQHNTPDAYEAAINKVAEKCDFRGQKIRNLLNGFEQSRQKILLDNQTRELDNVNAKIDEFNRMFGEYLKKRANILVLIAGIKVAMSETGDNSEIMEYFLANKHLNLISVQGNTMRFEVMDYLTYFNREQAEVYVENKNSGFYVAHTEEEFERMYPLMREIFVEDEPRLRVRMAAAYRFNVPGSVDGIFHHDFSYECNTYLPNPHIQEFHCLGNYVQPINELLQKGNYIGALEQTMASCRSVNMDDPSFSYLVDALHNRSYKDRKFIETVDGKILSADEAIQWLKDHEGV